MKKLWIALMALALVACGANGTGSSSEQATAGEAQNTKDTIRVALFTEIDSIDPYVAVAGDTVTVLDNMFDGLVDIDEAGEIVPNLATKWEISDDRLTYIFDLAEATFHNGKAFGAEDVVFSLERLAGLNGQEAMGGKGYQGIESVTADGDRRVVVKLKAVDASFLSKMMIAMVPKDYNDQATAPVGCGPYKFVEYRPGEKLVMERFDDYYRKDHVAKVKNLEWIHMGDVQTMISAIRAGEVDVVPGITAQNAAEIGEGVTVLAKPQNLIQYLSLNNESELFKDVRVRQALNYAIDRDEIIEVTAEGHAAPLITAMSPAMEKYYNKDLKGYTYDPEKAKALLKEAGVEHLTFSAVVPSDYQFHVDTAQVMANQFEKIGVTMKIEPIEFATWLSRVYTDHNYDATLCGFVGYVDPDKVIGRYKTGDSGNLANFSNARVDELIAEGVTAKTDEERVKIYNEVQKLIMEDAAMVYIQDPDRIIAVRPELKGLNIYLTQKMNMEDVYFE